MSYKIGIIGFGKMGKIRYNAIKKIPGFIVEVISDPNNIDVKLPNVSINQLIDNKDIDIVIICTPNYLNKKLTIKCLNNKKHVFCEKPPAFTAKDIKEIISAEKKSQKKLMYGFNHRHHDSIIKMKEIVDGKEFGEVIWMRGRYGKSVDKNYFKEWRAKKKYSGGGILIDQGIHMLDLFLYLADDFDEIKSEISNQYWKLEVE